MMDLNRLTPAPVKRDRMISDECHRFLKGETDFLFQLRAGKKRDSHVPGSSPGALQS